MQGSRVPFARRVFAGRGALIDEIVTEVAERPELVRLVWHARRLSDEDLETLVRLVAARCALPDDLGTKGQSGALRSQATRAAFLSNAAHRIQFLYTPKHTSWLNQIELWFSILARRVLKRGDFASLAALRDRIREFIAYFNQTAAPFKWTDKGRPLCC